MADPRIRDDSGQSSFGKRSIMKTKYLSAADPDAISLTCAALVSGQLVVVPTDTVYGLACQWSNSEAIELLFETKGRPRHLGIPLLLADRHFMTTVGRDVPQMANVLAGKHWPGPMTLVVHASSAIPSNLSPTDTVAIRVPDHKFTRELARAAGGAIAATSANLSGQAPATSAAEALELFDGQVAIIIDDGLSTLGVASTIVDCTSNPPVVLRHGALAADQLMLQTWPNS